LHGGYVKEYVKGKRVEGKALEDTWFLQYVFFIAVVDVTQNQPINRMNVENPTLPKWEVRGPFHAPPLQGTHTVPETKKDRIRSDTSLWMHDGIVGGKINQRDVWGCVRRGHKRGNTGFRLLPRHVSDLQ
jgi:hypothetical protein